MEKLKVKALGQTMEHDGETILVAESMPVDCMVLFVSKDVWAKIKDYVEGKDEIR